MTHEYKFDFFHLCELFFYANRVAYIESFRYITLNQKKNQKLVYKKYCYFFANQRSVC